MAAHKALALWLSSEPQIFVCVDLEPSGGMELSELFPLSCPKAVCCHSERQFSFSNGDNGWGWGGVLCIVFYVCLLLLYVSFVYLLFVAVQIFLNKILHYKYIYGTVSAKIAPRLKCYKNATRLNRYNFPTDNANDFLFSTLHTTPFHMKC